jgi:hypothetical protein
MEPPMRRLTTLRWISASGDQDGYDLRRHAFTAPVDWTSCAIGLGEWAGEEGASVAAP